MVNEFDLDFPNFFPTSKVGNQLAHDAVKKIKDHGVIKKKDLFLLFYPLELKDEIIKNKLRVTNSKFYWKLNDALKISIRNHIIEASGSPDNPNKKGGSGWLSYIGYSREKVGTPYGLGRDQKTFTFGFVAQEIILEYFQMLTDKRRFQRINGIFDVYEWGVIKDKQYWSDTKDIPGCIGHVTLQKQGPSLEVYLACEKPGFRAQDILSAFTVLDSLLIKYGIRGNEWYFTYEVRSTYKGKIRGLKSDPIYRSIIKGVLAARVYQHENEAQAEFRVNGKWNRAEISNQLVELQKPANALLVMNQIDRKFSDLHLVETNRFERSKNQFESMAHYVNENSQQYVQLKQEAEFVGDQLIEVQNQMMSLEHDKLQGDMLLETLNRLDDKLDRDEKKFVKIDQIDNIVNSLEEIKKELAAIKKQDPETDIWLRLNEDERIKFIEAIRTIASSKISWENVGKLLEHSGGNVFRYYGRRKTSKQRLINEDNDKSIPTKDNDLLNNQTVKQILEFVKNNPDCQTKHILDHTRKQRSRIKKLLDELFDLGKLENSGKFGKGYLWRIK